MTAPGTALEAPLVVGGGRSLRQPSAGGQDGAAAHGEAAAPAPADGIELLGRVGGSGYRRPPALVRRADGQSVQLSPLLYALLDTIDGEREYPELATVLGERVGKHVTADDVRFLTEAKLRPLGLLQRPDGTAPVVAAPNPLLALRLKVAVSSPAATRRLTAPFAWLFHPWIVVATIVAFALTTWWIAFEKGLASAAHDVLYRPALILVVLALTLLSAAFHEIGHAAACRYSGARPGRMGIGLYLVWPAFYTDVTDSYRLGRGGRLRVDLGGLYFNAIFAVATLGVWTLVHWDALLLVIAAQLLLMVRQLVPFVRFDGYHILADLVGVPDLFLHIKPTLLGLLPTRWGRRDGATLKTWVRAIVTLWVLAVVPVLGTFLVLMILALPRVAATAWASLGLQLDALEAGWAQADPATVAARLLSMLLIVLPTAGTAYLLVRLGRRIAGSVVRTTAGRPALRVGVALATAVLGGALAWVWWPDGQYQPIRPAEKGRLVDVPYAAAKPQVALARPVAYRPPPAETTRAARAATAVEAKAPPAPARPQGHAEWMVVLLPKRASGGGPPVVRPTVSLPAPVGGAPVGDLPTVTPPTDAPPVPQPDTDTVAAPTTAAPPPPTAPQPQPAVATAGAATPVTVVAPEPATPEQPKAEWVFPWAPPPAPKENDNQALAVNTTDGSTTYVVALSLVWVTDGGPVDERNTAYAAASCTRCSTVAVAFQAVFVIGYAQVVTPVNDAVAANYECDTCATGALAFQLTASLTRELSESAMKELAAVWAQLQQASTSFKLQPLAQVRAELSATRTQLLDIVARDGALAPLTSGTTASNEGESATGTSVPATTTGATTTTPAETTTTAATTATTTTATTAQTTTGGTTTAAQAETPATTTSATSTTATTTTAETRTAATTTAATTTAATTTTGETTTGQTTTGQTTTGQTTTTQPPPTTP